MIVAARPLWVAGTNCYALATARGGEAVLVDAPPDPDGVASLLDGDGLTPVGLLVTHGHVDHMGGAGAVVRRFGVRAFVHPADDFLTLDPVSQLRMLFGMAPPGDFEPPSDFRPIADGDVVSLAGLSIEVRHTPGHTPGHCCFYLAEQETLLSGDQLFAGSIGRTDLPGGDLAELARSMRSRVLDLPDDTRVLPGHGPETSIGVERRENPFRTLWQG